MRHAATMCRAVAKCDTERVGKVGTRLTTLFAQVLNGPFRAHRVSLAFIGVSFVAGSSASRTLTSCSRSRAATTHTCASCDRCKRSVARVTRSLRCGRCGGCFMTPGVQDAGLCLFMRWSRCVTRGCGASRPAPYPVTSTPPGGYGPAPSRRRRWAHSSLLMTNVVHSEPFSGLGTQWSWWSVWSSAHAAGLPRDAVRVPGA
jgi:hypothetical protein